MNYLGRSNHGPTYIQLNFALNLLIRAFMVRMLPNGIILTLKTSGKEEETTKSVLRPSLSLRCFLFFNQLKSVISHAETFCFRKKNMATKQDSDIFCRSLQP
jgi:hypothetical protein